MSPTYWTATQIKAEIIVNGWDFIKSEPLLDAGDVPAWGARRGRFTAMIRERRDGGLIGVWLTYPVSDGSNVDYLGPLYRDKLSAVLAFLRQPREVIDNPDNRR